MSRDDHDERIAWALALAHRSGLAIIVSPERMEIWKSRGIIDRAIELVKQEESRKGVTTE